MIKIAGSASFSFTVPTGRPAAFAYYSDMQRLTQHLKHMQIVRAGSDGRFRMSYETVELGAYTIHVLCDVHMELIPNQHRIRVHAIDNLPAVQPQATPNGTLGRGYYSSEAHFLEERDSTRIDYELKLHANLPPPLSLRFMPKRIRNKIAQSITTRRLREIAEHFIADSTCTLPVWSEQNGHGAVTASAFETTCAD